MQTMPYIKLEASGRSLSLKYAGMEQGIESLADGWVYNREFATEVIFLCVVQKANGERACFAGRYRAERCLAKRNREVL